MIGQVISAFRFLFMSLAIEAIDGCGPSSKKRFQLQPKKTKVRSTVLAIKLTHPLSHFSDTLHSAAKI